MTTFAISTGESALQKEGNLFRELFIRLGNALLNRIFDLKPESAARRFLYLVILLFFTWFLISLRYYPLSLWALQLRDVFLELLRSPIPHTYAGNAFTNFFFFALNAFTDPRVFQYFPIFLASFFIALQSAAIYLADVFELEDVGVARKFVWGVALSGSNEVIRVTQGDILDVHRETPTFLIGGPGIVVVDLDSVALFEKSNGMPHVIGPGAATLDGFERFREAIDIRDHYVDLRDQDPRSQAVKSRSRDGIPITATDVRLMFSIYRGQGARLAAALPYPFSKEAVEQIIYKASSRVTPDLPNPSTYEFSWINNMIGLIRANLGGFMNQHNLTVYLASTGMPEFEKAKQREEAIAEQVQQLTQGTEEPPKAKEVMPPPKFTPRYEITNLFTQFAEEFTKSARNRGVELHWIGVGTWKTYIDIIPEKHLEAWKLSQENAKNSNPFVIKIVEEEAIIEKTATLIQSVPINAYHDIINPTKQSKKMVRRHEPKQKTDQGQGSDIILSGQEIEAGMEEVVKFIEISRIINERMLSTLEPADSDHRHDMRLLLLDFRQQFIEAIEFMKAKNEAVPSNVEDALKHINIVLGYKHWAGSK
ncbi:MAG: hypothetical protein L0287_08425 [Anaerolineae bacterium]|nr:hypothetical protein [Anaerolineae bacterium]MCI0610697.1 hypothetical protein [Anaerolineae bacterium]